MTNDRAYRSAMTKNDAIEEIRKNSGSQFDPDISQLFINIITSDTAPVI
jgi:HD-GYP domain-containing protein (c-di-GMP phosphodiesterase class II)